MKRVGSWEENLLEYKKVLPNISLKINNNKGEKGRILGRWWNRKYQDPLSST